MKPKDLKVDGTEYALVVNKVKHGEGNQRYARVVIKETEKYLPGFREPTGAIVEFVGDSDTDITSHGVTPNTNRDRDSRELIDTKWIPGTWDEILVETRKRAVARAYNRAKLEAVHEVREGRLSQANELAKHWEKVYAQEVAYPLEKLVGNIVKIVGGTHDGKTYTVIGYATARLGDRGFLNRLGDSTSKRITLAFLDENGNMGERHLLASEDVEILPDQVDNQALDASYQREIQALEARYGEIPDEDKEIIIHNEEDDAVT